jgi:tetratricopeptide (TPR) repeat protein
MQLQLKYSQHTTLPVHAAFVPGERAADWFAQMDPWQTDLQTLSCYLLPHSIGNNQAAGLFVVFNGAAPAAQMIRYPYGKLAGKLFIPTNAVLYPVTGTDELKKLLLWDVKVFHPHIGLVGFEAKDKIELADFINLPLPQHQNWHFAYPGLNPLPGLQMLGLEPDENADMLDTLKEDVGSVPLSEIPDITTEGESPASKNIKKTTNAIAMVGLFFLLALAFIGKVIFTMLAAIFPISASPYRRPQKGFLQELEDWVNRKITDLQKQRDSELNRLMNLFDKDADEALKYAIPLNSPYLDRGVAPQSGKLSRRTPDFNLRGLGGGGRVDGWDLGEYRQLLYKKYEQSANDAIAAGNFKKAAYIYAHLLGNFHLAANVLQQGKLYREAAAIYKDHLDNKAMAAECLEKGGLLTEAIPLYIELDNPEKVGDLYSRLGQRDKALKYYNEKVSRLTAAKDYRQAAKITLDKIEQKDDALNLLMTGWQDTNNPEACLAEYFNLVHDPENNTLPQEVRRVYANHVPRLKKSAFLNVLADTSKKYNNSELEATTLNIAYEIISVQITQGEMSGLKLMNKFVPGDRLLVADANRFISSKRELPVINNKVTYPLNLRNDVKCIDIVIYHDQLLAIVEKFGDLHLERLNWLGKTHSEFLFRLKPGPEPWLMVDAGLSDMVMVVGNGVPAHINKQLTEYTYFERSLKLQSLNWLDERALACCFNGKGITMLYCYDEGLSISNFSMDGESKNTFTCKLKGEPIKMDMPSINPSAMFFNKDYSFYDCFYYCYGPLLLGIHEMGNTRLLNVESNVIKFDVTSYHTVLKIALLTEDGCVIVKLTAKGLKISSPFFAQNTLATDIKLLTDNKLVLAGGKQAQVYDISDDAPRLITTLATENAIERIIAIPKRHHCAFLEADNRISVYNIEE